jgi:cell wall-associated NlpC family hydrolase
MKGVIVTAGAVLLAGPVLGLAVLLGAGGGPGTAATVALCRTAGPVAGLDAVQARNARTIVAAAQQTAITDQQEPTAQARAALIALLTAGVESALHNYANPTVPASELLPNDGDPAGGGDHDSVGLFQQRASWGPLAARMDPAAATRLFVTRLLAVPAWQTMAPGVAAQLVQHSAYPARYAAAQPAAQAWLATITSSPSAADCGADGLPPTAAGTIPAGTLPAGYAIPATATDAERRAVTFALAQLGKPYVFGATGPDSYDCSGLTMAAWAAAGVALPHYTVAQYQLGTPVAAPSLLTPGDLIFIPGSDGSLNPPNPQHVGMYLGAGLVIEAPQEHDVVKIVPLDGFGPVVGIRHYG